MASFFVIRGEDQGRHFAVRGDSTTIGRDSSNQIRLNDTEASRQHSKVVRTSDAEFELYDCDSSNGTFVNSRRIQSVRLRSGDRVQIGRTLMIFTGGPEIHLESSTDCYVSPSQSAGAAPSAKPGNPAAQPVEIVARELEGLNHIRGRAEGRRRTQAGTATAAMDAPELQESTSIRNSIVDLSDGEIVYQVSQAIRQTIDITELLSKVLELIFQWIECDRGCILLQDDLMGGLRPACMRHRKQIHQSSSRPMQISQTILDHVMSRQEGVLTSNAQDDHRWDQGASIVGLGIREAICVPMQGRYGVQGAIYVNTEMSHGQFAKLGGTPRFDQRHLQLMIAIAGQTALAIEDTQFYSAMLQSERLATMGQTMAHVSHHVKNILQGISGGNFLVESGLQQLNMAVVQKGWDIVKKNQDRISSLVMDMLSFSKDRQPDLRPSDVNRVVSEVVELVDNRARESKVRLIVQLLPTSQLAMMDVDGIHHALLNVVSNAIDAAASDERPTSIEPEVQIVVEHSLDEQRISIRVTDNGQGIPEEQQSRIFAPFESSKGLRGTGLGLPVSQKILREHAGDLSLVSQPGRGTTFTLSWPVGMSPKDASTE